MEKIELDQQAFDSFIDYLLGFRNASIIPSGKEIKMACPFCGDSKSDVHAASFYINIDKESKNFLNYNCFRASCAMSGIVNDDFLSMIGFNNYEYRKNINVFLQSKSIKVGGTYKHKESKSLTNIINSKSKSNDIKLEYINTRLGLKFTYEDVCKLKISLDPKELLDLNNIQIGSGYNETFKYGIGLISAYNDYLIVRDIRKSAKKRYSNINIFNNYDNVTKAYFIPTKIDLLSTDTTCINIAEGVFDILGVKHNIKNNDNKFKNNIYIAACGSNIVKTLFSVIRQYGLIDCKINIYSDADVDISKYESIRKLQKYIKKFDVTVYYNERSKDYGVTKDLIKLNKTKL